MIEMSIIFTRFGEYLLTSEEEEKLKKWLKTNRIQRVEVNDNVMSIYEEDE